MLKKFFEGVTSKNAATFDIYFLGIAMIIGSQVTGWNLGLDATFFEYFTAMVFVAIGYICLTLCIAEMMSALPFSGGVYGLARVALSPYIGFLVGLLETIKNLLHISGSLLPLAAMIMTLFDLVQDDYPIIWALTLVIVTFMGLFGGRMFWTMNRLLGFSCLCIMIFYLISPIVNGTDFYTYADSGSTSTMGGGGTPPSGGGGPPGRYLSNFMFNLATNTSSSNSTSSGGNSTTTSTSSTSSSSTSVFEFSGKNFVYSCPLACWFFMGIELIPFACIDSRTATKSIPLAMIACMATALITAFGLYFSVCSQANGMSGMAMTPYPLNTGLMNMFDSKTKDTVWLNLILCFSAIFGYVYGCSRQISSLGQSGLFPWFLKWKNRFDSPYTALLFTMALAYAAILVVYYLLDTNFPLLFYICILDSLFAYISVFMTYIYFKKKYVSLKREFYNPLGVYSAYLGIMICLVLVVAILGLHEGLTYEAAGLSVLTFIGVGSIYYFGIVAKNQYYSEEEQKAFLITYVINSNNRGRKKNMKKGFFASFMQRFSKVKREASMSSLTNSYFFSFGTKNQTKCKTGESSNSILSNNYSQLESMNSKNTEERKVVQEIHDLQVQNKHNSIDFNNLPSLDVLRLAQQGIELDQKYHSKGHHSHHNNHKHPLPHSNIQRVSPYVVDNNNEEIPVQEQASEHTDIASIPPPMVIAPEVTDSSLFLKDSLALDDDLESAVKVTETDVPSVDNICDPVAPIDIESPPELEQN